MNKCVPIVAMITLERSPYAGHLMGVQIENNK